MVRFELVEDGAVGGTASMTSVGLGSLGSPPLGAGWGTDPRWFKDRGSDDDAESDDDDDDDDEPKTESRRSVIRRILFESGSPRNIR